MSDAKAILERIKWVIATTGGDSERSEFHRGWSSCCNFILAAIEAAPNVPDVSVGTESANPREAVEQHYAQAGAAREPITPLFKAGDLVVLRSGGPMMTVCGGPSCDLLGSVLETCWFNGAELKRDGFAKAELEPAPAKPEMG